MTALEPGLNMVHATRLVVVACKQQLTPSCIQQPVTALSARQPLPPPKPVSATHSSVLLTAMVHGQPGRTAVLLALVAVKQLDLSSQPHQHLVAQSVRCQTAQSQIKPATLSHAQLTVWAVGVIGTTAAHPVDQDPRHPPTPLQHLLLMVAKPAKLLMEQQSSRCAMRSHALSTVSETGESGVAVQHPVAQASKRRCLPLPHLLPLVVWPARQQMARSGTKAATRSDALSTVWAVGVSGATAAQPVDQDPRHPPTPSHNLLLMVAKPVKQRMEQPSSRFAMCSHALSTVLEAGEPGTIVQHHVTQGSKLPLLWSPCLLPLVAWPARQQMARSGTKAATLSHARLIVLASGPTGVPAARPVAQVSKKVLSWSQGLLPLVAWLAKQQMGPSETKAATLSGICIGNWSTWSTYSKPCGTGSQTSTYLISTAAVYGGKDCAVAKGTVISQACNTQPCPVDCMGTWGNFSICSKSCGSGTQSSVFTITTPPSFNGIPCKAANGSVVSQACNTQSCPVDCVGNWGKWTNCSKVCGSGVQHSTYVVTTPAAFGGKDCEATNGTIKDQTCSTQPCVPCVGHWGNYTACSKSCGTGVQSSTYMVTTPAGLGGTACEAANGTVKNQTCNPQACPVDCVGQWGNWTSCSKVCSSGIQYSTYDVITTAGPGGKACEAADGAVKNQTCNAQQCCPDATTIDVIRHATGGMVWGIGPYTWGNIGYDSDIGMAAVHAGLLQPGQKARLYLQPAGYLKDYPGSTKNGVATYNTRPGRYWCGVNLTFIGQNGGIVEAYNYLGCYKDSSDRTLPEKLSVNKTGMTVDSCVQYGKTKGLKYIGVQDRATCFGANDLSKVTEPATCNETCPGNLSQNCGGGWANAVYQL